jgi:hypothetical protein
MLKRRFAMMNDDDLLFDGHEDDGQEQSSSEANANVNDFVKMCIEKFFDDKIMHCGGKVPKYMVNTPNRVCMVINTNLCDAVDMAYKSLRDHISVEDRKIAKYYGEITSDIRMVNDALSVLGRSGTPQRFAGGMMILYLKYCKGVKIDV